MALWICRGCTAAFAVGASACPQCGGTDHVEDWTMPKISKGGGASYEPGTSPDWTPDQGPDVEAQTAEQTGDEQADETAAPAAGGKQAPAKTEPAPAPGK
jgi:hypothetical protein